MAGSAPRDDGHLRYGIFGIYDLVFNVTAYGRVGMRDTEKGGGDQMSRVVDKVLC